MIEPSQLYVTSASQRVVYVLEASTRSVVYRDCQTGSVKQLPRTRFLRFYTRAQLQIVDPFSDVFKAPAWQFHPELSR